MPQDREKLRWDQPFRPFSGEGTFRAALSFKETWLPVDVSASAMFGSYSLPGFCFVQAGAFPVDLAEANLSFRRDFINGDKRVDRGYKIDPRYAGLLNNLVAQMRLPEGGSFVARPFRSRLQERGEVHFLFWPDQETRQAALGNRRSSLELLRLGLPFLTDPSIGSEELIHVYELGTVIPVARNNPGYLSQIEMSMHLGPLRESALMKKMPWDSYETPNPNIYETEINGQPDDALKRDYKNTALTVSGQYVTKGDIEQVGGILASQGEPVRLDSLAYYAMAMAVARLNALESELVRRIRSRAAPPETPLV